MLGGAQATGFLAVAAGPVGIALVVGTLCIAGIDVALSATREFGDHVESIRAAKKAAEKAEIHPSGVPRTILRINRLHELTTKFS